MWEEFPPISTAEWEATIRADLKGADYAKKPDRGGSAVCAALGGKFATRAR